MSMRVTQRSIVYGSTANLQDSLARSQRVQEKLTSGKEISRPSDNPTDVHTALDFRATIRRADQLKRNADDGLAMLGTADTALTDTSNLIKRARDLAVQGANASYNAGEGPIKPWPRRSGASGPQIRCRIPLCGSRRCA